METDSVYVKQNFLNVLSGLPKTELVSDLILLVDIDLKVDFHCRVKFYVSIKT